MTTSVPAIPVNAIYAISADLKSLNEVLSKMHSSLHLTLSGYQITETLHDAEKGLLEVVRTNAVRRDAAPILQRLDAHGIVVDVDFIWQDYLAPPPEAPE